MKSKNKGMTLKKRRMVNGYLFILPWMVGFLFFFLTPIVLSVTFCFNKETVGESGYTLNYL